MSITRHSPQVGVHSGSGPGKVRGHDKESEGMGLVSVPVCHP